MVDIHLQYVHVLGKNNSVADLLSRGQYSEQNVAYLKQFIQNPIWLSVDVSMLEVDYTL